MSRNPDYEFSLVDLAERPLRIDARLSFTEDLTTLRPCIASDESLWVMTKTGKVYSFARDLTGCAEVMPADPTCHPDTRIVQPVIQVNQVALVYDFVYLATSAGLLCMHKNLSGYWTVDGTHEYCDVVCDDWNLAGLFLDGNEAKIRRFDLRKKWKRYSSYDDIEVPTELGRSGLGNRYCFSFCLIDGGFFAANGGNHRNFICRFGPNVIHKTYRPTTALASSLDYPIICTWDKHHILIHDPANRRVLAMSISDGTFRKFDIDYCPEIFQPKGALMITNDNVLILGTTRTARSGTAFKLSVDQGKEQELKTKAERQALEPPTAPVKWPAEGEYFAGGNIPPEEDPSKIRFEQMFKKGRSASNEQGSPARGGGESPAKVLEGSPAKVPFGSPARALCGSPNKRVAMSANDGVGSPAKRLGGSSAKN